MIHVKRGQGMTLNTIVVAALVLLVFVILALIFSGRISIFGSESAACKNNGGVCKTFCDEGQGEKEYSAVSCPQGEVCCLKGLN